MSVASIDETSTDSTRTEHEHNDERVLDQDQDQGHEENPTHPKVWNEIFEILYKPTPDINKDSLRRFTKTVKSVHSLESTSSVIDAAVSFISSIFSFWLCSFSLFNRIFHSVNRAVTGN